MFLNENIKLSIVLCKHKILSFVFQVQFLNLMFLDPNVPDTVVSCLHQRNAAFIGVNNSLFH